MKSFLKDPSAVIDRTIDWETWLGTDTIVTSSWAAEEDGITIDSYSNTTTTATVWLSGGTAETDYVVTNTITTTEGRTELRSINIRVQAR